MKSTDNDAAMLGVFGLALLNFIALMFVANWIGPAFSGLPVKVLDRSMAAIMPGFVFAMNTRPKGWPGWLRLAAGFFLLTGVALLVWLLAALAMSAALPPDFIERYEDGLQMIGLIPVFLLMFPLAAGLARIGLLPGFRWREDEFESPGKQGTDETPPGPPAWYPPGVRRHLPAIIATIGLVAVGDALFKRLTPIWPGNLLFAMDTKLPLFALAAGGFIGLSLKRDGGWLTLLAATLAGAAASCGVIAAFALALFLLWPGMPASVFDLLLALVLLLIVLLFVHREFRRGKEKPITDVNGPAEGERTP